LLPRLFEPIILITESDRSAVAGALSGLADTHTSPILTARSTGNSEARDPRLALLEGDEFKVKLQAAFEKNGDLAQKYLADIYNTGNNVQNGAVQADNWVRTAADQGHAGAQLMLGVLYFVGRCVPQNDAEAFSWTQQAARQGDAVSQRILGYLYIAGRGIATNRKEAAKWIEQAAKQGLSGAQRNLGSLYLDGYGIGKNEAEAFSWFHQAAMQGDAEARLKLGVLYKNGRGVQKDDKQAAYWLLQSGLSKDGASIARVGKFPAELSVFILPLFRELPAWSGVRTLDLSNNALNDQAAMNIAKLVAENRTLESLNLSGNPIGVRGVRALAKALQSNLVLKALILDEDGATESARADITGALASHANIAALEKAVKDNPVES